MPRGQYDRGAAKARKLVADNSVLVDTLLSKNLAEGRIADLEQRLAEALEKVDKLTRLCNTHGLWIE